MDTTTKMYVGGGVFSVFALIAFCLWFFPQYSVWQQTKAGEAALRRSEFEKQVIFEEAKAKKESAKMLADAEVARAIGVAEANEIIGKSLQGNEAYLRYLWIQGLQDGSSEVIYVPTEANMPILEATRNLIGRPKVPKGD